MQINDHGLSLSSLAVPSSAIIGISALRTMSRMAPVHGVPKEITASSSCKDNFWNAEAESFPVNLPYCIENVIENISNIILEDLSEDSSVSILGFNGKFLDKKNGNFIYFKVVEKTKDSITISLKRKMS